MSVRETGGLGGAAPRAISVQGTPDQLDCIEHLDGPLLVCAGAGSGKTATLTKRVAWALTEGSGEGGRPYLDDIGQVLVITFTNKAAAEIKERIRSTLRHVGRHDQALKVDGAWISTIHGMCSRILRTHALELGLDPDLQIAAGPVQDALMRQAMDAALRRPKDAQDEERIRLLLSEYRLDTVERMLRSVVAAAGSLPGGLDSLDAGPAAPAETALARRLLVAFEMAEGDAGQPNAADVQRAREALQAWLEQDPSAPSRPSLAELLGSLPPLSTNPAGAPKELKEQLRATRACLVDTIEEANVNAARPLADVLLGLARSVDAAYRRLLREAGLIDPDGLLRATLSAFKEHPGIAQSYADRFKLVMVDEFQDTSQLQIDIIERLAGPRMRHLCTVGDAQQSIYRFRGADVAVYKRHKADMAGEGTGALCKQLARNFRSHADVLAFVRAVCGQQGYFDEPFLDLEPCDEGLRTKGGRAFFGTGPRIEVVAAPYSRTGARKDVMVAQAARVVAARFAALRDAGHSPNDMVVLMGTMGPDGAYAAAYADALRDVGFDCVVAGGSGFFATPEVRLCQCILQVLANPEQSQQLLPVLASDVLPVSSDDLLKLATWESEPDGVACGQSIGLGVYREGRVPKGGSPLLRHALSVLHRAWRRLGRERPSRIFERFVVESGWLGRMEAGGVEGQAKAANVLKYGRLVADAERAEGFDMARTARYMAACDDAKEAPGALAAGGDGAVRILTVHASKGLEFPIVAATECFTARAHAGSCMLLADGDRMRLSLSAGESRLAAPSRPKAVPPAPAPELPADAESPVEYRRAMKAADAAQELAERRRLFYVAATRAAEALIVVVCPQETKACAARDVEADILHAFWPGAEAFPKASEQVEFGASMPLAYTRVQSPEEEAGEGTAPAQATRLPIAIPALEPDKPLRLLPRERSRGLFSYSSIAAHDEGAAWGGDVAVSGDAAVSSMRVAADADAATDFGSALHRVCEWVALAGDPIDAAALDARMDAIARAWRLHDAARLRLAVGRWLSSEVRAQALGFEQQMPEVPFSVAIAGAAMEGAIDLLCRNADGAALVVDYKTGGSPAETPAQLHEKHLLQAQCYAFVVLSGGAERVDLRFVRVEREDATRPGQPQVVPYRFARDDLPALAAAISDARAAQAARKDSAAT